MVLVGRGCSAEHPRIRGENNGPRTRTVRRLGTSPHTRGKLTPRGWWETQRWEHPRIRGENSRPGAGGRPRGGNIPAYAGKTRTQSTRTPSTREHPRIRGENPLLEGPIRHQPGTSPHTRGKPRQQQLGSVSARNIPAYAGKTYSIPARLITSKEHPRIRGENFVLTKRQGDQRGTSPHTRGKRDFFRSIWNNFRNIPAYAGKTVHEHVKQHIDCGTSPHTRGKQYHRKCTRKGNRNIPAYAGKTFRGRPPPAPEKEHPRIRGENSIIENVHGKAIGTSPHTRGKRRYSKSYSTLAAEHPRIRGENSPATSTPGC